MISNRSHLTGQSGNNNEYEPDRSWVARVPLPLYQRTSDEGGLYPWRVFEERVRTGPYGLSRFPSRPYSPIRILVLDGGGNMDREDTINPRLRQFIQNSPPRIRQEWNLWTTPEQEDPGLTENEFKSAMKQLKKQVYQPSYPPKKAYMRSIFRGRSAKNEIEVEKKEEGKDCSICLESFARNEQVLVTPCKHMFHSDCITPWVKSHGKCPVCRFAFYKRNENQTSRNNNNNNNNYIRNNNNYNIMNGAREIRADDELALDLIALVRAMEEAFNWVTLARAISHE